MSTQTIRIGDTVKQGSLTATIIATEKGWTTIKLANGGVRRVPNALFWPGDVKKLHPQAWIVSASSAAPAAGSPATAAAFPASRARRA